MSTCCTRLSARFRLNSIESSLATRHDQCVADSAPKRTTSHAAGFSTTDTSKTVNCRPTLENGLQPKASISTVPRDSNSIEENVMSVRTYYSSMCSLSANENYGVAYCTAYDLYCKLVLLRRRDFYRKLIWLYDVCCSSSQIGRFACITKSSLGVDLNSNNI